MRELSPILIIDDDEDFCCLLQIALEEAQVGAVEMVHDGWAAIDRLRQGVEALPLGELPRLISLILLDLVMPGLSGLEVLQWIRSQPALDRVAVVVFTGLEQSDEHSRAIELGATELRLKPFAYRDLLKEATDLREAYLDSALKHAA